MIGLVSSRLFAHQWAQSSHLHARGQFRGRLACLQEHFLPSCTPSPLPSGKEARRATSRRLSQLDAWNRSALSEDAVRDRKLRQLCLASSRIQGLRAGRGQRLLCMPQCRVATWRSSVVLENAGGDHTGAHVKACTSKSLLWCFLALFIAVDQTSLMINSAYPSLRERGRACSCVLGRACWQVQ